MARLPIELFWTAKKLSYLCVGKEDDIDGNKDDEDGNDDNDDNDGNDEDDDNSDYIE